MGSAPPREELRGRLERFRAVLARKRLSGAVITDGMNVRYLSGFTGDDSALLVTASQRLLLTDFRYVEEAQRTAPGWRIVTKPAELMEKSGVHARKLRVRRLGVESNQLSLNGAARLRKAARGIQVRPHPNLVEELRLIKSPWELRLIEAALRIQEQAFLEVCRWLKPGIREREAAAELRYRMVRMGAGDQAFDCMCQWGSHSSLPHGRPSDRKLRAESVILIDWGAQLGGYHADLTRTFFLGTISPRLRRIHEIVAQAQALAIAKIAPGIAFAEVDKAARRHIRRAGFGRYFGHSTGHGLGLRIHEAPRLSSLARGELKPGMVVTVEPGIYLPGVGGVRIEDDVLVTARGHRKLSRLPVGLRWNGGNE